MTSLMRRLLVEAPGVLMMARRRPSWHASPLQSALRRRRHGRSKPLLLVVVARGASVKLESSPASPAHTCLECALSLLSLGCLRATK